MEKTISKKLRINAKDTMKIAEKLYTQGFISYPRTETNIFPKELNLTTLVEQQQNDGQWGPFARRIMAEGGPTPRQGKKSDQVTIACRLMIQFINLQIFLGPSSHSSNQVCR